MWHPTVYAPQTSTSAHTHKCVAKWKMDWQLRQPSKPAWQSPCIRLKQQTRFALCLYALVRCTSVHEILQFYMFFTNLIICIAVTTAYKGAAQHYFQYFKFLRFCSDLPSHKLRNLSSFRCRCYSCCYYQHILNCFAVATC